MTTFRCPSDIETLSLGNILQLYRVRSFYITNQKIVGRSIINMTTSVILKTSFSLDLLDLRFYVGFFHTDLVGIS